MHSIKRRAPSVDMGCYTRMNRFVAGVCLCMCVLGVSYAQTRQAPDYSLGIHGMMGVRYDDVRMCVSSGAGVRGGPVGDVTLDLRRYTGAHGAVLFSLPVMRPVLFGAAFRMLQFEPAVHYEHLIVRDKVEYVWGPGLGISLHYGPDYRSNLDDRGEEFFAAGPQIYGFFGIQPAGSGRKRRLAGLRVYYHPLFSASYRTGTVAGVALEGHFTF